MFTRVQLARYAILIYNQLLCLNSAMELRQPIINVSFPRSGHRFLKDHLAVILGSKFKYFDHYRDDNVFEHNFVKTHDFQWEGQNILLDKFPTPRKYLVQVRHPLESIISYYEFRLHWGTLNIDDREAFQRHLNSQLAKWRRFCNTWVLPEIESKLVVTYNDLYEAPSAQIKKILEFICDDVVLESSLDIPDLPFNRYHTDQKSRSTSRKIEDFRYFDEAQFRDIETTLYKRYLLPVGIKKQLT